MVTKLFWFVLGALVLAFVLLFVAAPRVDRVEFSKAEAFCGSISVGQSVAELQALSASRLVKLDVWPAKDGVVRYQAWFSGFLGNAGSCDVVVSNGIVKARFAEHHTW